LKKEKWRGLILDRSEMDVSESISVRVNADPVGKVEGNSSAGQLYVSVVVAVWQGGDSVRDIVTVLVPPASTVTEVSDAVMSGPVIAALLRPYTSRSK